MDPLRFIVAHWPETSLVPRMVALTVDPGNLPRRELRTALLAALHGAREGKLEAPEPGAVSSPPSTRVHFETGALVSVDEWHPKVERFEMDTMRLDLARRMALAEEYPSVGVPETTLRNRLTLLFGYRETMVNEVVGRVLEALCEQIRDYVDPKVTEATGSSLTRPRQEQQARLFDGLVKAAEDRSRVSQAEKEAWILSAGAFARWAIPLRQLTSSDKALFEAAPQLLDVWMYLRHRNPAWQAALTPGGLLDAAGTLCDGYLRSLLLRAPVRITLTTSDEIRDLEIDASSRKGVLLGAGSAASDVRRWLGRQLSDLGLDLKLSTPPPVKASWPKV